MIFNVLKLFSAPMNNLKTDSFLGVGK